MPGTTLDGTMVIFTVAFTALAISGCFGDQAFAIHVLNDTSHALDIHIVMRAQNNDTTFLDRTVAVGPNDVAKLHLSPWRTDYLVTVDASNGMVANDTLLDVCSTCTYSIQVDVQGISFGIGVAD